MAAIVPDSVLISAVAGVLTWAAVDRTKPAVLWDGKRGDWRHPLLCPRNLGLAATAVTWYWASNRPATSASGFGAVTLGQLTGGADDFENEALFRAGTMQLEDLL